MLVYKYFFVVVIFNYLDIKIYKNPLLSWIYVDSKIILLWLTKYI